jgi:hypothetical protein
MDVTRQMVSDQLLAYLNEQINLAALVDWAENIFIDSDFVPDEDARMLRDIVSYLAAADSTAFPLTWEVCLDFLKRLGMSVKVVAV